MNRFRSLLLIFLSGLISLSASLPASAQGIRTGFDSTMRSSGRIYVVIAVILVILFGLIIYLVRLDRKMTRLEKE